MAGPVELFQDMGSSGTPLMGNWSNKLKLSPHNCCIMFPDEKRQVLEWVVNWKVQIL